ncbi:hypothetical protein F4780DRAFT_733048 [Xylariomycetidae sp. FL0641]|nr:hypothetical protein F4780DRAFT_733048 [Xylariomycetidae sp. FL0641]
MALSRSASGPGGLSINTSTANNMFGPTSSQPPAAGGLFGSSNAAATPKPGGLFGSTTPAPAASQPQQTSSLFGPSTATSQPQPAAGGLFGASTAATQAPQTSGGLFGASSQNTNQTQTQNQTAGGGLFGGSTAAQSTAPASGGLFGASSQPTNNAATGGILGQSTQQKPGIFGTVNSQPANSFGQSQPQSAPTLGLGGSLGIGLTMGQSTSQQTVPGVRIDLSNLKPTTRFNDLQEDLQKQVETIDNFILAQMRHKSEVDSFMPAHGEMLESIPDDVKFVARKYDGARNALESAAQAIESARILVNQDADNARLSFRAVDNLKLPQQYHTSSLWSPRQPAPGTANTESDGQDLVTFFSRSADEMADQMRRYEKNLTDIETHMHGVSDGLLEQLQRMMATKNGGSSGPDERIQELVAVLRDFEQGILKVAGDVGSVREGMTRLQLGDFIATNSDRNGVY